MCYWVHRRRGFVRESESKAMAQHWIYLPINFKVWYLSEFRRPCTYILKMYSNLLYSLYYILYRVGSVPFKNGTIPFPFLFRKKGTISVPIPFFKKRNRSVPVPFQSFFFRSFSFHFVPFIPFPIYISDFRKKISVFVLQMDFKIC